MAATLIATTFFLFFAFVVNTGMLVHAKINLQNAADVAAYAGASVQARQLDAIGALNYDLRRQYKRFLYRYINFGNSWRPDQKTGNRFAFGAYRSLSNRGQFENIQVPSVCLVFKPDDNYCNIYNLEKISVSDNRMFFDAIGRALGDVLDALEKIRQRNCAGLAAVNFLALAQWLYNTDPEGAKAFVNTVYTDEESRLALQTLPSITEGLGVIPRNQITYQRINTLKDEFMNLPGRNGIKSQDISAMRSSRTPMIFERPIL
ncbi:MAG: hypothetical protein KGQ59_06065, partial [Bdellovibrionales bacterium]|nr:hypothetical protein [Bdellovibrionales bacterium]